MSDDEEFWEDLLVVDASGVVRVVEDLHAEFVARCAADDLGIMKLSGGSKEKPTIRGRMVILVDNASDDEIQELVQTVVDEPGELIVLAHDRDTARVAVGRVAERAAELDGELRIVLRHDN